MIFPGFPGCSSAHRYALDVVSGDLLNCQNVILACKRHLSDLGNMALGFYFDPERAERAINFIEKLPHTKGRWAAKGARITLEPWQKFIVASIFGWVDAFGLRRYRYVYIEVPRKNGKSILGAAIGLYMLVADGEYGAEVYCGATNEKQALEVFTPARAMCKKLPAMVDYFGIETNVKSLVVADTGAKFLPVIGSPGDGSSPSCWIIDEYHEHPDSSQYDTADTGMGAREQPLLIVITTAGSDTAGPCYLKHREIERLLTGQHEDPRTFGVIYGLDTGDDWRDADAPQKANPNYGVSVTAEYLQDKQARAARSAVGQNAILIKHFDVWTTARSAWMNTVLWDSCADPGLTHESVKHLQRVKAVDLATKVDIAAEVDVYFEGPENCRQYYVLGRYYIPEEIMEEPPHDAYYEWSKAGLLVQSPGAEIDFNMIEDLVRKDLTAGNVREVTYDPWRATQLAQSLESDGALVVQFLQQVKFMSPAMKEVMAAVMAGRLKHDGNPVLAWMLSNVVAKEDAKENVYPRKETPANKIDGATALIMGVGRAMYDVEPEQSVYDKRGVREL